MSDPPEHVRRTVAASAVWADLEHHGEVTSTNDVALARVRAGAPPGTVVTADTQTAGRGRRGRTWQDRAGGSLLLSAVVTAPPGGASLVPLAAGLAVADACDGRGVPAALKWPNDVLVDGRKLAGILVEGHDLSSTGEGVLVVGIGVNVDWRGHDRPPDLAATSLAEVAGADVDRWEVLADLLGALQRRVAQVTSDPGGVRDAYRRRSDTIGAEVRVTLPGGEVVAGRAVGLDDAGGLVLATGRGERVVVAGDVERVV